MYTFLTQHNSPNYTPASQAVATWGKARTITHIAIHWWGDPAQNPSFGGIVSWLCNPASGVSAHFVATGTNRQVACLVDPADASWATGSANPYTISIECDPRCRDEDYDVVGELVAELRATYGNLPLMPHSQVVATRCPGNYDLNRINAVASRKVAKATDQYGLAKDLVIQPTTPIPTPVTYKPAALTAPVEFTINADTHLWDIAANKATSTVKKKGEGFRAFASVAAHNKTFYITEYSYGKGILNGVADNFLDRKNPTPTTPTPTAPTIEQRVADVEAVIKKLKEL